MGALKPGYRVTDELLLVRRLGAGGMGTVWIANHEKLRTEVVVKFLSEALASDPDACARFEREVSATIQVRSPHVVQTLDHGITEGGLPYIVMELLEGTDLAKALRQQKHLRPDEAMHVIEGVAAALTRAHERGIVHRDIKPANVFLCSGGPRPFVKLVDFGIAKRLEDETMTATNALIGTPAYMSPEQMEGSAIDHRTDLWALGVLAFHMLSGNVPFRGAHIANIAHAILHEETPPIRTTRPELPPAVDQWMARALARDPMMRFGSAREMADTLAVALGDLAFGTTNRRLGASGANPAAFTQTPAFAQTPGAMTGPGSPFVQPSHPPPQVVAGTSSPQLDVVGTTLGASAITHAPLGASPRMKIWVGVMGLMGVLLVYVAFRVGAGMRSEKTTTVASEAPPPATVLVPTTATTTTAAGGVLGASPPPIMTQQPAVTATTASSSTPPPPPARTGGGARRGGNSAGKSPSTPSGPKKKDGEDDVGF